MTPARTKRTGSDDGLTLVEMVVALGIAVTIMVAAAAAMISAIRAQQINEMRDQAVAYMNDHAQQSRATPFTALGFNSVDLGYRAQFDPDGAGPMAAEPTVTITSDLPTYRPMPLQTMQVGGITYTVRTDITWGADAALGIANPGTCIGNNANCTYTFKRVTITVTWNERGRNQTITTSTASSPSPYDAVPPAACQVDGVATGNCAQQGNGNASNNGGGTGLGGGGPRCPMPTPFCVLYTRSGAVLNNVAGFPNTVPILIHVKMYNPADTVKATINGTDFDLDPADMTGGGAKSWSTLIPAGTSNVFEPGYRTVLFTATGSSGSGFGGGGTQTRTTQAFWGFDSPAELKIANPKFLKNTAATTGARVPYTGAEPATPWFCVRPDGRLWYSHALIVDAQNVNEMDGPADMSIPTFSSTAPARDPARPSTDVTRWPTGADAGYNPATGFVGAVSPAPGTLNTRRWVYQWPAGATFTRDQTTINATVQRPADGQAVSYVRTVPVHYAATAAACADGDTSTQPVFPAP